MNKKHFLKFVVLSIIIGAVLSFLVGMFFGILESFLEDMKSQVSMLSLLSDIVAIVIVLPAISMAARITYKKAPVAKDQVSKIALINTLITLVLSSLVFLSPVVGIKMVVAVVADLILTYVGTSVFVKKYSI